MSFRKKSEDGGEDKEGTKNWNSTFAKEWKSDCFVVFAVDERLPENVVKNIKDYVVIFLVGPDFLSSKKNYRDRIVSHLKENIVREKVVVLVYEPADRSTKSWGEWMKSHKMKSKWEYDKIKKKHRDEGKDIGTYWDYLKIANIVVIWLPCYFSSKRAGPSFLMPKNSRANAGRVVWIEVGYLLNRFSQRKSNFRVFIGGPNDVKHISIIRRMWVYHGLKKWYGLSVEEKKKGLTVSQNLLHDVVDCVNDWNGNG